jgi:tRNA pseudouridine55 synthase
MVSSGDAQDTKGQEKENADAAAAVNPVDNIVATIAHTGTNTNAAADEDIPPIFELEMTVSSGTYVRSVVHDLGVAVGSAAHVVVLTRTRQGQFISTASDGSNYSDSTTGGTSTSTALDTTAKAPTTAISTEGDPCVDWRILEAALVKWESGGDIEVDEDGWAEWELEMLSKWPKQVKLDPEHAE